MCERERNELEGFVVSERNDEGESEVRYSNSQ